jgi:hypothetical protein
MKAARILALSMCVGCGSGALSTEAAPPAQEHPVIGQLRTRNRRITLLAAREGLRVALEDASGGPPRRETRDMPLEELRGIDPEAYELLRTSVASVAQPLDARLDLR